MNAKEQAKELVERFTKHSYGIMGSPQNLREAKACAYIAIDEIQKVIGYDFSMEFELIYWSKVKEEIEKL